MSELLLELFSEEIPARMQKRASEDLLRLVTAALKDQGLTFENTKCFATPRRLSLVLDGLPQTSPDVREERRGPKVGAPEKALQGFMRSAGLDSLDKAEIISDAKKGDFYLAIIEQKGRPTADILAEIIPDIVRKFPWPKSMRWGSGTLRWVRPLQSILCILNGKVVPFEIEGLSSGNITYGHRFMAPQSFKVKNFADYHQKLGDAKVVLSSDERVAIISEQAQALAETHKLSVVEDQDLLMETAGLVEWPCVLIGSFEKDFLDVPPEVLSTSMKSHQKCFSLTTKDQKLTNKFLLVSNLVADDGGAKIIKGNERVIKARLSDAKFFWDNDKARPLESFLPKLELVTFHQKLGTQAERVARIEKLAIKIAQHIWDDTPIDLIKDAARLCKADLVSETVYEFPELQGLAGRYIALAQGHDEAVANACAAHYKPQGPSDAVPTEPVSIAVALADKIDMLVGFWKIDEKPTGSKDPYALRRAALGVIRIVLENKLRVKLIEHFEESSNMFVSTGVGMRKTEFGFINQKSLWLLSFFADRLKVYLRDQGARHDLIDAVFALGDQDDLLMIVKRVTALGAFLDTDDGANLLAGVKRAANILRIEEKKEKAAYDGTVKKTLLNLPEETALFDAIQSARADVHDAVLKEDFEAAMAVLARLRVPVDAFFEHVIVNDEDAKIRMNRLNLLADIRNTTLQVADFSKIEG